MSIYIISGILALLILLVGYAVISTTLEKRRVQRQRLLTALKLRERNFKYMITGLPPHFLSNDLSALVYQALIDTCEQLTKLDPKDPLHQADANAFTAQLGAIKQSPDKQRVRLENPAQVKEVRQHLQELLRFVAHQEARKLINPLQAATYSDQIKRLSLQISVDAYVTQGKQAQQVGKLRLAIHFFTLARKLLTSENASHSYDKQIAQLQGAIAKLEETTTAEGLTAEGTSQDEKQEGSGMSKEWDQFGDDEWKKKQVYD
jgi:hypothetical protein